jgi:hypothetical protein
MAKLTICNVQAKFELLKDFVDVVEGLVVHLSFFINFPFKLMIPFVHLIPDPHKENATSPSFSINMESLASTQNGQ